MPKVPADPSKFLDGNKKFQIRARAALPILTRQAMLGTPSQAATLFYADLAAELGMPNPRNLNAVLGYVGQSVKALAEIWHETIPPISCLVVNKQTELPGGGVGFFTDRKSFAKLPSKDKKQKVAQQLNAITSYTKWPEVVSSLGLVLWTEPKDMKRQVRSLTQPSRESRTSSFGGGGESPQHKRLKDFVAKNPSIVGLPKRTAAGKQEKPLRSGDILDVFFVNGLDHIAVEVKSAVSSVGDIERGIYQCVKYVAVLQAQQSIEGGPLSADALLVLESTLPRELIALKNTLGVRVIENIKPS